MGTKATVKCAHREDAFNVDSLPLRPVISNIGTATYEISKYLASLLQPLTKNEYTIDSTKHFIERLRGRSIPAEYEMVSFDVVSLFTSVPLDFTIDLILEKIYRDRVIETKLKREELRNLLKICTKEMHFSFNGEIYKQCGNGLSTWSRDCKHIHGRIKKTDHTTTWKQSISLEEIC